MRGVTAGIAVVVCLLAPSTAQQSEVVSLLQELVRLNTSNPPGNEAQVAELLAPRLRALGFEVEIIQPPTPGKAHLVACLRAANPTERSILLAARDAPALMIRQLRRAIGDRRVAVEPIVTPSSCACTATTSEWRSAAWKRGTAWITNVLCEVAAAR